MTQALIVRDEGVGPAILLLHAFPCDGSMWDEQAMALRACGWRTLVPDLPGFGGSELPAGEPDLASVVQILSADLHDRGLDRVVLAGLSLGGYLSMEWLRFDDAPIAGLVLCDTKASADHEPAAAGRERIATEVLARPELTGDILEGAMLPALLAPDSLADERVLSRVRSWLHAAKPESIAWYQRAMARRPDSHPDLAAFDGPALVLRGELDAMSGPEELARMQAALAGSVAVEVPRAGHLAATEQPEAVSAALVDFVRKQG